MDAESGLLRTYVVSSGRYSCGGPAMVPADDFVGKVSCFAGAFLSVGSCENPAREGEDGSGEGCLLSSPGYHANGPGLSIQDVLLSAQGRDVKVSPAMRGQEDHVDGEPHLYVWPLLGCKRP